MDARQRCDDGTRFAGIRWINFATMVGFFTLPAKANESDDTTEASFDRFSELRRAIDQATHLLPTQGPITVFVHHNTLHAFEDRSFDEGVKIGQRVFGCHPYLPEHRYREKLERGRIRAGADLGRANRETPPDTPSTRRQEYQPTRIHLHPRWCAAGDRGPCRVIRGHFISTRL